MTPPIAVAAGSPTWRRGMRALLSDLGFESVEFEALEDWAPGVGGAGVVVRIGDDDAAFDPVERFVDEHPLIPLIAVVDALDAANAATALRSGAAGVLGESDAIADIADAIASAMSGRVSLPGAIALAFADRVPDRSVDEWITEEQASWLVSLADGVTVADLAERIGWSERETFRMLGELYRHLGARNRTEAIIWAARHGLVG